MDLQAQDRAFRIGQTRDVSVYRFIARGALALVPRRLRSSPPARKRCLDASTGAVQHRCRSPNLERLSLSLARPPHLPRPPQARWRT